jgi:hypothetical protein
MMTDYNVKFTDISNTPITVLSDSELPSGTDLTLFGRSFLEYGEQLNENLVRLLENFACPESLSSPGEPDTSVSVDTLTEPVQGQIWFNTTAQALYQYDGDIWTKLSTGFDYAANWGQISDGQTLPLPVSQNGRIFNYNECIWMVSPAGHAGRFDYMVCTTGASANVICRYRLLGTNTLTTGVANYLIIGIDGNTNNGLASYSAIGLPDIQVTPTPTVSVTVTPTVTVTPSIGASPTPTPNAPTPTPSPTRAATATPTPTPTNTPSRSAGASPTPTQTPASTPIPSNTNTPTPTPSQRPPLQVQIVDSARGGTYTDSLSLCDLLDYELTRDYGIIGCSTTFDMCAANQCAPAPGTYIGGGAAVGPEMGITVSGGVAPYTVRLKNFTVTSQTGSFSTSGDCVYFGGSLGFTLPNTGTVYSLNINSSGGLVSGLYMTASCGSGIYSVSGNFNVEVTDAVGAITTNTYPYNLLRRNSTPEFLNFSFEQDLAYWTATGGGTSGWGISTGNPSVNGGPAVSPYHELKMATYVAFIGQSSSAVLKSDSWFPVAAGVTKTAVAKIAAHNILGPSQAVGRVAIEWYNDSTVLLGTTEGNIVYNTDTAWVNSVAIGVAPAGTTKCRVILRATPTTFSGSWVGSVLFDYISIVTGNVPPAAPSGSGSGSGGSGGGSGGSGGGSGGCVTTDSIIYGSGIASSVMVGDMMNVIDPLSFEMSKGEVSMATIAPQPCVRITTRTGVMLECSTTAPIALADGTQALAPTLAGLDVSVYDNGMIIVDTVVLVEDIGVKDIVYITCENNYFLAGAEEGRYLLHHNLKSVPP